MGVFKINKVFLIRGTVLVREECNRNSANYENSLGDGGDLKEKALTAE